MRCPTKEDLRRITKEPSDTNELHMVEQVRAYYLIQGALIKLIQEDGSTGMAQIRAAGIKSDLWTTTSFSADVRLRMHMQLSRLRKRRV
jgi:hypothetical protein